jgi:hypothetical protein
MFPNFNCFTEGKEGEENEEKGRRWMGSRRE